MKLNENQDLTINYIQETHFKSFDTCELGVKDGEKKCCHSDSKVRQAIVAK